MSGWEASIKTNYSFGKLARNLEKVLKDAPDEIGQAAEMTLRGNIDDAKYPPLRDYTKMMRKKGKGWGGKDVPPVTHDIPLRQTDALYNSLKYNKKTKSIDMMAYGLMHHRGFPNKNPNWQDAPPRPFLDLIDNPDGWMHSTATVGVSVLGVKLIGRLKKFFKTPMTKNIIK